MKYEISNSELDGESLGSTAEAPPYVEEPVAEDKSGQPETIQDTDNPQALVEAARRQVEEAQNEVGTNLDSEGTAGTTPALANEKTKSKEKKPTLRVRPVKVEDIPRLAEIDLAMFEDAYGSDKPSREEVVEMLTKRLAKAGDWMIAAEVNGKIEGFLTGQLSDTTTETFKSWEETTDNGTLESTFNPDGEQIYVVNLTVMPEGSKYDATDMLMLHMFGKMIIESKKYGMWVSRMPRFREWAEGNNYDANTLSDEDLDALARQYLNTYIEVGGKQKLADPQLRFYKEAGFELVRAVKGAFEDPPSLNYGVVCKAKNPIPEMLRIVPVNFIVGKALQLLSRSPRLAAKIFG